MANRKQTKQTNIGPQNTTQKIKPGVNSWYNPIYVFWWAYILSNIWVIINNYFYRFNVKILNKNEEYK
jgi:hypothetical protein